MNRIQQLQEFLNDSPGDSFLQHALALEYIKSGNDEAAKELFCKILEADPLYIGSYYHLGKLMERRGEIKSAMTIYAKGMEIANTIKDRHSYNELLGAFEDAEEELE